MTTSPERTGGYDAELFDRLVELEDRSFWFRGRNRLIVDLARRFSKPGDSVLEVGCGTGYVLRALVRECGLIGTGSELHGEGLEYARKRVPEADFVELDACEMEFEDCFDHVGSFDVIEHIEDDLRALRGLRQAVRPGGTVLLTVPQHPWLWSTADEHAHHVRRYRRGELVERVCEAGLTPVLATSFVTLSLPAMVAARWRDKRNPNTADPLAALVPQAPVNRALELSLDLERLLIRKGLNLPVGGSLALMARR